MPRGIYNRKKNQARKSASTGKRDQVIDTEPQTSISINGQRISFEIEESEGQLIRSALEQEFRVVSKRYNELKKLMDKIPVE